MHDPQALEEAEEELKSTEAAAQVLGDKEAPPEAGEDATLVPTEMTVAALQEALAKRSLDTKWNPLNKKKELVDRLSVRDRLLCTTGVDVELEACRGWDILGTVCAEGCVVQHVDSSPTSSGKHIFMGECTV